MNTKLDIICWAFPSWRGDYMKSTVELMKELAVNHNVLYIDYAYSWKDILVNSRNNKYIPVKNIINKKYSLEKFSLDNGATINVLSLPAIIPFNWCKTKSSYNFIQGINKKIVLKRIKNTLKKLNFNNPIMVNAFNPFFGAGMKNVLNGKASIYYCYDNIAASTWASKHGAWLEADFMKEVDAVIYTSDALKKNKSFGNTNAYVVSNGVDLSLYENEMEAISVPDSSNENKNIVYTGSIDNRLDYDLLKNLFTQFSTYTFHFIGRIMDERAEEFKNFSNVKCYGAVDVKQLAGMMKNMDAGIIPFVKNEFTKNIYPMKVNEYLALGLPVVMTNFAELHNLKSFVEVSTNASEFSIALLKSVSSDNINKRIQRSQFAKTNSWKNKAIEFEQILFRYAS